MTPPPSPSKPPQSRRRSRILAFRVLFELDMTDHGIADLGRAQLVRDRQFQESGLSSDALDFTAHLLDGVIDHRDEIDAYIREFAPAFPLEDLSPVDRNVLRLAIYEVLFDTRHAPLRVAINEAVDIAKGYGSESSGRFVNGVLGAVALQAARLHGADGTNEESSTSGE